MAAEQRLRKIYMCVCVRLQESVDIFEHIYFEAFSFPHCEQALLHTYAVPAVPTCTAFPVYHLQLVQCVCVFCFLINKWTYLIKVLQLRLHSGYRTPGSAPIVLCVLTPMMLFALTPIIHLV